MAVTCLFAIAFHVKILLPLLQHGFHTEAVVSDIDVGAKGSKMAIYRFQDRSGKEITARDKFQMYYIRLHKGDHVNVIYDPDDPRIVTADLGIGIWQGTAIFVFGFVLFSALGVLILKYKHKP